MTEKKINLTLILVTQEIQAFLANYPPNNPYRVIFSIPYFQKRLITKVLAMLPQSHTIITDVQTLTAQGNSLLNSWRKRLKLNHQINKFLPELFIETYQELGEELVKQKSLIKK